jgi:hypothetical protein
VPIDNGYGAETDNEAGDENKKSDEICKLRACWNECEDFVHIIFSGMRTNSQQLQG